MALQMDLEGARRSLGTLREEDVGRSPDPAQPAGLGLWDELLEAAAAKERWLAEIRQAKEFVRVLAFTFDLSDVMDELTKARKKKCQVEVALDRGNALKSANARPLILQMIANGVAVRVINGRPLEEAYVRARPGKLAGLSGILHAKVLWTERVAMIGSCNFTTSSQANREIVAVVRPNDEGREQLRQAFAGVWEGATAYPEAVVENSGVRRAAAARARGSSASAEGGTA